MPSSASTPAAKRCSRRAGWACSTASFLRRARAEAAITRAWAGLLLVLLALLTAWPAAPAHAARLTLVDACVQPEGRPSCRSIAPSLPFHWDLVARGEAGSARFLFRLDDLPVDAGLQALMLPRAGNGFTVLLDGKPVAAFAAGPADLTALHDATKRPWLIPLPPTLTVGGGTRELVIVLHATPGRGATLQSPEVGDFAAMNEAWSREHLWQVETTRTLAWIAALIAVICGLMWAVQRDVLFLGCGVAQALWASRLLETLALRMPLPWPAWGGVVATLVVGTQLALTVFFLHAADRWDARWRRATLVFVATWVVGTPAVLATALTGLWVAWLALALSTLAGVALYVARVAFRARLFWRWLLVAWLGATVVAVVADVAGSPGSFYLHPTWSRLAVGLFSLALVAIVARQLREAHLADRTRSRELRKALSLQQQRLQALHEGEARREVERATWVERQRLMRDMHDGLGAQLYGLHALAGRPDAQRKELQGQIRAAIEELRLVVDAMNPFDGDLAAMIGDLRTPLERRLAHSQVELRWSVDELPTVGEAFSPARVQHLKRLLLEAATNIARHSGASEARLSASAKDGILTLELADNGHGFDPASPRAGNGLRNMRWRAMMIGAQFEMDAREGEGCRIRLRLPLPSAAPTPLPATTAEGREDRGDMRGLAPPALQDGTAAALRRAAG